MRFSLTMILLFAFVSQTLHAQKKTLGQKKSEVDEEQVEVKQKRGPSDGSEGILLQDYLDQKVEEEEIIIIDEGEPNDTADVKVISSKSASPQQNNKGAWQIDGNVAAYSTQMYVNGQSASSQWLLAEPELRYIKGRHRFRTRGYFALILSDALPLQMRQDLTWMTYANRSKKGRFEAGYFATGWSIFRFVNDGNVMFDYDVRPRMGRLQLSNLFLPEPGLSWTSFFGDAQLETWIGARVRERRAIANTGLLQRRLLGGEETEQPVILPEAPGLWSTGYEGVTRTNIRPLIGVRYLTTLGRLELGLISQTVLGEGCPTDDPSQNQPRFGANFCDDEAFTFAGTQMKYPFALGNIRAFAGVVPRLGDFGGRLDLSDPTSSIISYKTQTRGALGTTINLPIVDGFQLDFEHQTTHLGDFIHGYALAVSQSFMRYGLRLGGVIGGQYKANTAFYQLGANFSPRGWPVSIGVVWSRVPSATGGTAQENFFITGGFRI